ncbi:MAG: DUF6145 family protein [Lachnospiraceae bacterium]|nr:DUF6145 family protein [Lachnospiraceae bacterium]
MENVVLCGCNSYVQKYYLNPDFEILPSVIKDELKIMCVLFTEEIGGILTLEFDEEKHLFLRSFSEENDFSYDEIGAALKAKKMKEEKKELLGKIELFYQLRDKVKDLPY